MAATPQEKAPFPVSKKAAIWAIIAGVAIFAALWLAPEKPSVEKAAPAKQNYSLCADARDRKVTKTTVIRVQPDCWSGWIKLTPGTKFDLISSDEAELFYWGGSRKKLPNNRVGFLGRVPSTFSIRGKGGTVQVRIHDE